MHFVRTNLKMSIFIRDYVWKQTETMLSISIPIKNMKLSKLDIFSTDEFIKINYAPFIFQLFLYKPIIRSKTRYIVRKNDIRLELYKEKAELWDSLQKDVQRNKITETVREIYGKEEKNETIRCKEKSKKSEEFKRFLREESMAIHMKEKEKIQHAKNEIMNATKKEIISWEDNLKKNLGKQFIDSEKKVAVPTCIPFPREHVIIPFSFTERIFPTPKRESKSGDEKEWLRKEAEARRCTGFIAEDLTEEERDPSWLLSKGESFMKHDNYSAAVNVFAFGTQIKPKMPIFYVRLAEAHFKLKNFYKTIKAASKALDFLTPAVESNKHLRADADKIRSMAFQSIDESKLHEANLEIGKVTLNNKYN